MKCLTPGCKKEIKIRNYCPGCRLKKWRVDHPLETAYTNLRNNAKRRGKPFTITLEDFKAFCEETDYLTGKGRTKLSYHIDCKIEALGYVPGNLQRLTNTENITKENNRRKKKVLVYDWQTKQATVISTTPAPDPENPF